MPFAPFTPMTPARLAGLIARFVAARIAVVGDFFLDKYLEVDPRLDEPSVETGKTAHQVVAIRHSPGAAGTVVSNLAALMGRPAEAGTTNHQRFDNPHSAFRIPHSNGSLHAIGIVGDDGESYDLLAGLRRLGCAAEGLIRAPERHTPTYLKPRNQLDPTLAGEYERYDTKNRTPTPSALERRVIEALDAVLPQVDAVIIADQVEEDGCGVVTAAVREALADRARRHPGVIFFADSRRRIREFRNVIIKPNEFEAVGWDNPPPRSKVEEKSLAEALPALRALTGAPVLLTRGAAGMIVSDPEPTAVPGVCVAGPLDTTGAGDSATAGTVLALAAGATLAEAALLGNLVASITIQQLATTGVAHPDQLPARLVLWLEQQL